MRMPSGTTDQYIYFVAIDSTDYKTRKTGLSSFTVYRSRDGGAATAYTTPTVTEVDSTNMPGVYKLLLDEDMTIGTGNDSEEMALHITATGMLPVTRTIELYRRSVTGGETVTSASGKVALTTTSAQEVADETLKRSPDGVENTASVKSLAGLLMRIFNVVTLSGGTLTVKKNDGTTTFSTQSVTQTAADPITSQSEVI